MARMISFLTNYLVDLWRRCFGRKYLVKATGNSPIKHDFRKCPECGAYVPSLNPFCDQENCKICNAILHEKGLYVDHKSRSFSLHRPLHGKYFACVQIILLSCIVVGTGIIHIVPVPDGYFNEKNVGYISVVYFAALIQFLLNWGFLVFRKIQGKWYDDIVAMVFLFATFALAVLAIILSMEQIRGYSAVPRWVDIPTQQEVYDRQKAELDKMPIALERFSKAEKFASNPQINLADEFLLSVKKDLSGMMEKYSDAVRRLEPGSTDERIFFEEYRLYLKDLQKNDPSAFEKQCRRDPWNLATGWTLERYSFAWASCK